MIEIRPSAMTREEKQLSGTINHNSRRAVRSNRYSTIRSSRAPGLPWSSLPTMRDAVAATAALVYSYLRTPTAREEKRVTKSPSLLVRKMSLSVSDLVKLHYIEARISSDPLGPALVENEESS